jgi:O-antigen/teichoic acid export membrane protein
MRVREVAGNAMVAFLSQSISLLLSALTSLLVPKVLGVSEFGYWQLFIFYTSYCGFFHFGINDGVYLLNGGKRRKQLDFASIKGQFIVETLFQFVCALAIGALAVFGDFGEKRAIVLFLTGIYLILFNLSGYLGYVFQAVNETKIFSFSIMVDKLIFLIPMSILLICRVQEFEWYAIAYAFSKTCALIYCIYRARDILSSHAYPLPQSIVLAMHSISVGIKLMIANIASMLILGVARFAIDAHWGIEIFGKLSFSLSLVNFFIQFVSQASMVLFPALRQSDADELRKVYQRIRDVMELYFPFIYLLYYPIVWIIGLWLPAYKTSLDYFVLLLPLCLFNTKMDICCTTYFKVLRKERLLLRINIVTVIFSSIFVVVFTYIIPSVHLIIGSVVVFIILRSFVSELIIDKILSVRFTLLSLEEIIITALFVALSLNLSDGIALVIYAVSYAAYLVVNKRAAQDTIKSLKRIIIKS